MFSDNDEPPAKKRKTDDQLTSSLNVHINQLLYYDICLIIVNMNIIII